MAKLNGIHGLKKIVSESKTTLCNPDELPRLYINVILDTATGKLSHSVATSKAERPILRDGFLHVARLQHKTTIKELENTIAIRLSEIGQNQFLAN